jgi:hypothetical protein
MTLVEFYDKSPLENIVGSLVLKPRKVVFLGSNTKHMERDIAHYNKLWRQKGVETETECRFIKRNDLAQIQQTLFSIADENPECAVDLTGGDELSLVAVGTVAHSLKEKNISFHRVNVNTRKLIDFFGVDFDEEIYEPTLSVEENIVLYGGSVVFDTEKPGATHMWNLSDEFTADINALWEIVRRDCGGWNTQMRQLESIISPKGTDVFCKTGYNDVHGEPVKLWNKRLFYQMQEQGLISAFRHDRDAFSFSIKNEQLSRVMSKAGAILELKTFLLASALQGKNRPHFNDVMTGVYIDWDGEVHQQGELARDTENEIDVLCMRGLLPLFISCKNGSVEEDELYKLNTVAQRFGGEYGRKALVCTYINKSPRSLEYFRQRASDMGITLIDGVDKKSDKEFSAELKNALA